MNKKVKNNLFSSEYFQTLELYKKLHNEGTDLEDAKNTFDGKSLRFYFKSINQIVKSTKSDSIIDFGCGKAKYYFENIEIDNLKFDNVAHYWGIKKYYLYDPGIESFSNYPSEKADGVICIDVVEHIPEHDVINFIDEIFKLSIKFIFIVIACYPAIKTLPDGRNVHLSIKSSDEWKKIISEFKKKYPNTSSYVICATERNKFVAVS
tara:strand:- start:381 stop:1001 length:621 start_codon:yes stop_codon:yes gene_type:complete